MNINLARVRTMVFTSAIVFITATLAHAQASQTWVSGVGDDVNPCSRTSPCKTFAGALVKTAVSGFIGVLDPGNFGAVTITKSVTIDGSGGPLAVVLAGGNGIIVNSAGAIVHLRNLSIRTVVGPQLQGLNGIQVIAAAQVHVEKCVISGFLQNAINFQPAGQLVVADTSLYNNAGGGIVVQAGRATIENLHANGNGNAVAVNGNAIATVRNSYAANGSNGFVAVVSPAAVINVEGCVSTNNTNGIVVNAGATARVSNSTIASNSTLGLSNDGVSFIVSLTGNSVVGNVTDGAFTSTLIKQ